jgi:hypothetical protein
VCYDLSSSYEEGTKNELARFGYSRDGERGTRQVEYGIVATWSGLPLAIKVFPGNTADPASFAAIVTATRERFGLRRVVFVGDRGTITQARIATLAAMEGFGWVTALRTPAIRALAGAGTIQPSLFDERDLAEITHPNYPGERLVVCRNPLLAAERARKREALLAATEADLAAIARAVEAGLLHSEGAIGLRVGRVLSRHKMAKHCAITIAEGSFAEERKDAAITEEAALDGLDVLRTSEPPRTILLRGGGSDLQVARER